MGALKHRWNKSHIMILYPFICWIWVVFFFVNVMTGLPRILKDLISLSSNMYVAKDVRQQYLILRYSQAVVLQSNLICQKHLLQLLFPMLDSSLATSWIGGFSLGSWTPHKGIIFWRYPEKNTTFLVYFLFTYHFGATKKPCGTLLHNPKRRHLWSPGMMNKASPRAVDFLNFFHAKDDPKNQVEEMSRWQVTSLVKWMNILDTLQIGWCTCPKT